MAGIPFLSRILALAGISVKNTGSNKEAIITVSPEQTSGTTVSIDLPSVSGTLVVKSQVVLASEKAQPNGVATLDGSGKIPTAQIPPYAITDVFVVADETERLALMAQVGDVAVQSDVNKTYILRSEPASIESNWVNISATNAVTAVNGHYGPGPVILTAHDVGAVAKTGDEMTGPLYMGPTSTNPGGTGQIAFRELAVNGTHSVTLRAPDALADYVTLTLPQTHGTAGQYLVTDGTGVMSWVTLPQAPVTSVNGKTGAVVLTTSDIAEGTNLYFTDARAQAAITGGASSIVTANLTIDRALISNSSGKVAVSSVTSTELGYLSGVTSSIQTQLGGKVSKSGDTMTGALVMGPTGTTAGSGGIIKFQELAANGTNYVALKAADSIETDVTWTLPSADGTTRQALVTDGTGVLSWESGLLYLNYNGSQNTVYSHVNPGMIPGAANTAYGYNALIQSTGALNTAVGFLAGSDIGDGHNNTFVGGQAGHGSLFNGGSDNTAIGANALSLITPFANQLSGNIAIGSQALSGDEEGPALVQRNIAIGQSALQSPSSQSLVNDNIAIGYNSSFALSGTALQNIAIGSYSFFRGTGLNNVFIGQRAGASTNGVLGDNNVGVGSNSLSGLTQGTSNVAIGQNSGSGFQQGQYNTFINGDADVNVVSGAVAIGTNSIGDTAYVTADNQFVLGVSTHRYVMNGKVESDLSIGSLSGSTRSLKFFDGDESNYLALRAPEVVSSSVTWTLPAADGTAGQVLKTNASGQLYWADASDASITQRVEKLEGSRGVYTGVLASYAMVDISSLVDMGNPEYPIVQVYKDEAGMRQQVNIEFSFDPLNKTINFGEIVDGPINAIVHVLALTAPYTTLPAP